MGWLKKLFTSNYESKNKEGRIGYLFAISECKQPDDQYIKNEYLLNIIENFAPDFLKVPDAKNAVLFETSPVDKNQLVNWAAQLFGEQVKNPERYKYSFGTGSDISGNNIQVLIVRHKSN